MTNPFLPFEYMRNSGGTAVLSAGIVCETQIVQFWHKL